MRLTAEALAKAFGLWPTKGRIAPGAHADVAIVDPKRTETIRAHALHSRAKVTPFDGVTVTGVSVHTLVRGRFVQRDRRFVSESAGWGRPVTEIQRMPAPVPRTADLAIDRLAPRVASTRSAA